VEQEVPSFPGSVDSVLSVVKSTLLDLDQGSGNEKPPRQKGTKGEGGDFGFWIGGSGFTTEGTEGTEETVSVLVEQEVPSFSGLCGLRSLCGEIHSARSGSGVRGEGTTKGTNGHKVGGGNGTRIQVRKKEEHSSALILANPD
jgi:hypothetical protein